MISLSQQQKLRKQQKHVLSLSEKLKVFTFESYILNYTLKIEKINKLIQCFSHILYNKRFSLKIQQFFLVPTTLLVLD